MNKICMLLLSLLMLPGYAQAKTPEAPSSGLILLPEGDLNRVCNVLIGGGNINFKENSDFTYLAPEDVDGLYRMIKSSDSSMAISGAVKAGAAKPKDESIHVALIDVISSQDLCIQKVAFWALMKIQPRGRLAHRKLMEKLKFNYEINTYEAEYYAAKILAKVLGPQDVFVIEELVSMVLQINSIEIYAGQRNYADGVLRHLDFLSDDILLRLFSAFKDTYRNEIVEAALSGIDNPVVDESLDLRYATRIIIHNQPSLSLAVQQEMARWLTTGYWHLRMEVFSILKDIPNISDPYVLKQMETYSKNK